MSATPQKTIRTTIYRVINRLDRIPALSDLRTFWQDRLGRKYFGTWIVIGAADWKHAFLTTMLTEMGAKSVRYINRAIAPHQLRRQLAGEREATIIVWGMTAPDNTEAEADHRGFPLWRIEDGFIRSVGLGSHHIPPASLILDRTGGLYFWCERPSEMENLLNTHQFTDAQRRQARSMIDLIVGRNITKYNVDTDVAPRILEAGRKNILVLGQCEDDNSILFGSPEIKLNTDLVSRVVEEYPDANVFFRPHPDVMAGRRIQISDVSSLGDMVTIIDGPYNLWAHIEDFDRVCVMTSLGGFEALLRGVPVTTYGLPFYAGWGLTTDRQTSERRGRKLTLEEAFYGAYMLAPTYIDPETGTLSRLEVALDTLHSNLSSRGE